MSKLICCLIFRRVNSIRINFDFISMFINLVWCCSALYPIFSSENGLRIIDVPYDPSFPRTYTWGNDGKPGRTGRSLLQRVYRCSVYWNGDWEISGKCMPFDSHEPNSYFSDYSGNMIFRFPQNVREALHKYHYSL